MAEEKKKPSVFDVLSAIDCGKHTEVKKSKWTDKKGVTHEIELTYLSWAWAWHICKQHYPLAFYTIYETPEGRPYFDDGRTAWVKTGVTIEGLEYIEYLPIMDHRNLSIPVEDLTSMDMNKAIQRSLTKALARHGLGLYIYAGEDLPWSEEEAKAREEAAEKAGYNKPAAKKAKPAPAPAAASAPAKKVPSQDPALWAVWVAAIAEGRPTKSGKDSLQAYKDQYHPTAEELTALEEDVFKYQLQHGIDPNEPKFQNA